MNRPIFSILIVNYNGVTLLKECLSSLEEQSFQNFEIILVDNGSSDGSADFIKKYHPRARLILSADNKGFSGGNNLGIPHCQGEFVFFLNNDVYVPPNLLQVLHDNIKNNQSVNIFSCFLVNYYNREIIDSGGDTLYGAGLVFSFTGYPISYFSKNRFITTACGGAAVYRRSTLDKIGWFDNDFFLNLEDVDLGFRAQHMGEKILFISEAKVYHKSSHTLGGKFSKTMTYYLERNHWLFLLKNIPGRHLIRMLPIVVLAKLARLFRYGTKGLVGTAIKGNIDGLIQCRRMFAKRREILSRSVLSANEFENLLRKGWLWEKITFILKQSFSRKKSFLNSKQGRF